jgi:hypothetical protein
MPPASVKLQIRINVRMTTTATNFWLGDYPGGVASVHPSAWTGANCSTLNLLPAKKMNGYGSLGSPTSSWGGGVLHDPVSGKWVMQVSEIAMGCGLGSWRSNSRCVIATAEQADGPNTRQAVMMDPWCHGASPGK